MGPTTLLFDIDALHKRYGQLVALDELSLSIDIDDQGSQTASVGLLGPNGAGKSTLIKTLLGLLSIDRGRASVLGHSVRTEATQIRRAVGYMPEDDCYRPYVNAVNYVSFQGQLSGLPRDEAFRRAHEVLFFVGLDEARYRELGSFSTGMKQRAKLAQAIVHGPRLLFLDEPTNGLDPEGRQEMLSLIEDVRSRGVHIVLSTHLLPDVERICRQVILLNQGRLVHVGPIDALQHDDEEIIEIQTHGDPDQLMALVHDADYAVQRQGTKLLVTLDDEATARDLLSLAVDAGIEIRHFMPQRLTLESAFVDLIEAPRPSSIGEES